MGARRCEGEYLLIDTLLDQDRLAKFDIAMPWHHDVIVARVIQDRIAFIVCRMLQGTHTTSNSIDVRGWVIVVMKINDRHEESLLLFDEPATSSTQAHPRGRCQVR